MRAVYTSTGKVAEFSIHDDHISICVDYDDGGTQCVSFPRNEKFFKRLFPLGQRVTALFNSSNPWGRTIDGLKNNDNGEQYVTDPVWKKEFDEKQKKEYEEAEKKRHEEMMAIPRYRYESKYQFPDDINIWSKSNNDGEGFRNSTHLSVSRGMEFMEGKDLKDFSMREYDNIKGVTEDNDNIRKLKDHINKCVMKELGDRWGHSGMSMILATGHVLKAKELGWDGYIEWIRSWSE